MWSYLFVILGISVACILFGLLRAELPEDRPAPQKDCDSCDEAKSCGHFCFRQPMTRLSRLFRLED